MRAGAASTYVNICTPSTRVNQISFCGTKVCSQEKASERERAFTSLVISQGCVPLLRGAHGFEAGSQSKQFAFCQHFLPLAQHLTHPELKLRFFLNKET